MKIENVKFIYTKHYLPDSKCRKKRIWDTFPGTLDVEIAEPTAQEFPVAFMVRDYKTICRDALTVQDFNNEKEFRAYTEEIRLFKGDLYKPVRIRYGVAISTLYENGHYIRNRLSSAYEGCLPDDYQEGTSIVTMSTKTDKEEGVHKSAEDFLFFDGKFWEKCGEPYYKAETFRVGQNRVGTSLFIHSTTDKDEMFDDDTFNALEHKKAVRHALKTAKERGDEFSLKNIKDSQKYIKTLIPDAVHIRSTDIYEAYKKERFEEMETDCTFTIGQLRVIARQLKDVNPEIAETAENIIKGKENA